MIPRSFVFLLCLLIEIFASEPEIDLYCFYTPAFKNMYEEYFLPSIKDPFRVIVREYPQDCPSGVYSSKGWKSTMQRKLDLMMEAIKDHWDNQIFIFSDIDIIFLRPILPIILEHLGEHDFLVQRGWPRDGLCAGFFVMRGNERTLRLLHRTNEFFVKEPFSEQKALQKALDSFSAKEISWAYLPIESFPNGAYVLKHRRELNSGRYQKDSEIILDKSIALFHANCCVGLENKYHFLHRVQEKFNNQ